MPEPARFGNANQQQLAVLPAYAATVGLVATLSATLSDLQPTPYGNQVWLLIWAVVLGGALAMACGRAWGRWIVVVWAALTAVTRLRDGAWFLLGVYAFVLIGAWTVRLGPRPDTRWGLRWPLAAVFLGACDLLLHVGVGELDRTRLKDLPSRPQTAALPAAGTAWVGSSLGEGPVRLVWRRDRFVLEGSAWVRGQEVTLDPGRCALAVGPRVFRGRVPEERPEGSGGPQPVLVFERENGRVRNKVLLIRTDPDVLRLLVDLRVDFRPVQRLITLRREATTPSASPADRLAAPGPAPR